mmetsp:Transcript_17445/g.40718  ORF Transcript_17445/g.40718 Transcript_17445/m.40718 type:complete len:133 (+) Transcript_17445:141-539(+)
MTMATVSFMSWVSAEAAAKTADIAVVAFIQEWLGPSRMVMNQVLAIAPSAGAVVCLVDYDSEAERVHQLGICASPCLMFYSKGRCLTVQRPEVDDANKYVGSITDTQLTSLLQQARECAVNGQIVIKAEAHL